MAGMQAMQPNAEPLKYSLDYETYLANVFHSFTGRQAKLKELATGEIVVEYEKEPDTVPITNVSGGLHIVNGLRGIYNRHAGFGQLTVDDAAEIAGNVVKSTFNPMFAYAAMFGVKLGELSRLSNAGLNQYDSIYTFLTSLIGGGLREFGVKTVSVTYVQKPAEGQAAESLYST